MKRLMLCAGAFASTAVLVACGGGGGSKKTETPAATSAVTAAARSAVASSTTKGTAGATTAATTAAPPTAPASVTAAPTVSSAPPSSGKTYNATQAKTLADEAALLPRDLTKLGAGEWVTSSDTTTDNATAAAADPRAGASFERCGRLTGRTVVNTPKDVVSAFLQGESVTVFSTLTAYMTDAGAADCSAEAAVRFQEPGELARAFGKTFVDPLAVVVALVDYPTVGDGSFAATLTGKVNANGVVVDITILIVGFRKGNVTAAVGSAHSAGSIPTSEMTPLVDAMLARITTNQ